jgi:hypothetical protein
VYRAGVKTTVTAAVTALLIAPAGIAVGVAKDPRVPALQRRVSALERVMYTDVKLKTDNTALRTDGLEKRFNLLCQTFRADSSHELIFYDFYIASGPC